MPPFTCYAIDTLKQFTINNKTSTNTSTQNGAKNNITFPCGAV